MKTATVQGGQIGARSVDCGDKERVLSPGVALSSPGDLGGIAGGVSTLDMADSDADGTRDDGALIDVFNLDDQPRKLSAWAICLGKTRNDIAYENSSGVVGGGTPVRFNAGLQCDAGKVAGVGAGVSDDPSAAQITRIGVSGFNGQLDPDRGTFRFISSDNSIGYDYTVACFTGSRVVQKTVLKPLYPTQIKTFKVACPRRSRAVGGGLLGEAAPLLASAPYDSKDRGKAPDDGWSVRAGAADYWSVGVEAVCLKT